MRRSTFITYAKEQAAHTHILTHTHTRTSAHGWISACMLVSVCVCVKSHACGWQLAGVLGTESCMPRIIYEFDYFKLRCLNGSIPGRGRDSGRLQESRVSSSNNFWQRPCFWYFILKKTLYYMCLNLFC